MDELLRDLQAAAPGQRIRAARQLGKRRVRAAAEPLAALLADPVPAVRDVATLALSRLGDARAIPFLATALVASDTGSIRDAAYHHLIRFGAPAVPALVHLLAAQPNPNLVAIVVNALGAIDDPAVLDPLVQAAGCCAALVRGRAVAALGPRPDPRAFAALLQALDDPDRAVQAIAIQHLAQRGDPQALAPLRARLHQGDWRTILPLQRLGDPDLAETLVALLATADSRAARPLALYLAYLGDRRAREPLLRLLAEPGIEARRPVVQALDRLAWLARGSPDPRPPDTLLRTLLEGPAEPGW